MNSISTFPFFFLLILFSWFSPAQSTGQTISGQLLDQETKAPIVYASIYVKGLPLGTTSNEEGYFVFNLPPRIKSHSIIISAIGYTSLEKEITTFIFDQKILLSSQMTRLDEVLLTAVKKKQLTAKELIRRAYRSIPDNYPSEPYILEGFIRDLQHEDDAYVEYLECAARFSYKGYQTKREPLVELIAVRTNNIAEKHPWNKNEERKNSIIDIVEDDFIRFDYGPIGAKKGWTYELDSILPYNNRLVYKINATDKPFQKATLYIDTETHAFVRMELTRSAKKDRSWRRRFTNGALQVYYNVIFEYQEYQGKMYLKYQKEEDTWKIFKGLESNKLLFTKNPKKELFINKIVTEGVTDYPFNQNMDIGSSIEDQASAYDAVFWSTYNAPQQTKEQSKIIQELQRMR
ncbi:MAG: carboxypeptidase-like regulatory domain-containing protein [Bacteroidota bacterium]